MRIFIFIFILAAFLQTTIVPINLCLVLLVVRSLIVDETYNYLTAFIGGIILGVLSSQNIGFWPIIFLLLVKIGGLAKRLPFSTNIFTAIPICFLLISSVQVIESFVFNKSWEHTKILLETLLCFPTYMIMRFFEERFVASPEIKLKLKNRYR